MTDKNDRKNLSLKSHKGTSPKRSNSPSSSKSVTIQVKRKRIFSKKTTSDIQINKPQKNLNEVINKENLNKVQQKNSAQENLQTKPNPGKVDIGKGKKKTKVDKDRKFQRKLIESTN